MRQLGVALIAALLLAACASPTSPPGGIPAAQLAPVSNVNGHIPSEAGRFGVLMLGLSFSGEDVHFSEPRYSVAFDAHGSFGLVLPETVAGDPLAGYGSCDFAGHAVVGLLYTFDEPVGASAPFADIRGAFLLKTEGRTALYWFSPVEAHIQCESAESSNLSGGKLEVWDLLLQAGWNQVSLFTTPDANHMRSHVATGAKWEPTSLPY